MKYYIAQNGQPVGPMEATELLQHGLTLNSQVWNESMTDWVLASQVPELVALLGGNTTVNQVQNTMPQQTQYPQQPQGPQGPQGPGPQGPQQPQQPQYQQQTQYPQPYTTQTENTGIQEPMPKTWMLESILTTIFCCLPIGLASVVLAYLVKKFYKQGNYEIAESISEEAGKLVRWGVIIGLIWGVIWGVYYYGKMGVS